MNKIKTYFLSILFIVPLIGLLTIGFLNEKSYEEPNYEYQVYLDGEKLGLIKSSESLYNMINKEQTEVKTKYNTNQVYPPKGFEIVKTSTYNENLSSTEEVYEKIKEKKDFTIKGYTITIKNPKEEIEPTYIYVVDKEIFENALNKIVTTFIGEERYKQYIDNTQPEIIDKGYIIENMYFDESITIKESYISVNEKIFTDEDELTKYLLFSDNNNSKTYTVVQGDTLQSIANSNELNITELIIANDSVESEDTLLAIGQKLNVALINPVLSLVYEELVTDDIPQNYSTSYEEDSTKYTDYKVVKVKGENGLSRITTRVQYTNGAQNQGAAMVGTPIVIKPVVNEVIIKGTKRYSNIGGVYVDNGDTWAWPTNQPYCITSKVEWRWGTIHNGIDISCTGYGSPIYASLDGEVVNAQYGGMVGSAAGYNVVLKHDNGYYTVYGHLSRIAVKKGQRVSRTQIIGYMGASGNVTGTHLHFGLYYGQPYGGGTMMDPLTLWK